MNIFGTPLMSVLSQKPRLPDQRPTPGLCHNRTRATERHLVRSEQRPIVRCRFAGQRTDDLCERNLVPDVRHISPVRNGLVSRSWPNVEPAPWPQIKLMSSPSGISFSVIDLIRVSWLPPGRSVRPTEPLNRTSPTWAKCNSLL